MQTAEMNHMHSIPMMIFSSLNPRPGFMPARNPVEHESRVIEQYGRGPLVGSSGDAVCPLGGSR